MHNDILSIGSYTIHGYGLMIGLGVLFGYFDAVHRAKKAGASVDEGHVLPALLWSIFFGLVGAKVLYWLTILPAIAKDPRAMFENFSSGFVIYGALLGAFAAVSVYSRRHGLNYKPKLDIVFPSIALGQGFGRIGCLLAGCCYGRETCGAFAITFHNSQFAPNGVALVPTQILSSALDFCNYIALCIIYKHSKRPGVVTACYLLFYSVGRFILEFFRGDLIRGSVGALSTSQFISLFVAAFGAWMLWSTLKKPAETAK